MTTQARVFRSQRSQSGNISSSPDGAEASTPRPEPFRAASGAALAAEPFEVVSCCEWPSRHGYDESRYSGALPTGRHRAFFPVFREPRFRSGFPPKQLRFGFSIPDMRVSLAFGLATAPDEHRLRDGKATWPKKFVSPARLTRRAWQSLKTTSSQRFTTSAKMNTH
jgi:hypothetical protein